MLSVVFLLIILTGCKDGDSSGSSGDSGSNNNISSGDAGGINWASTVPFDPPEYILLMESVDLNIELPDGVIFADNFIMSGDVIYFTARDISEREFNNKQSTVEIRELNSSIFSYDLNSMTITRFPDFTHYVPSEELFTAESTMFCSVYTINMHAAGNGNFLLVELIEIFTFDLPENINLEEAYEADRSLFEYKRTLHEYSIIRKIDNNGADLIEPLNTSKLDIYRFKWWNPNAVSNDAQGNLYVFGEGPTYNEVLILDPNGNILSHIKAQGFSIWYLLMLTNGNVAAVTWDGSGSQLREINIETESLGKPSELLFPNQFSGIPTAFQGNGDYPVLYSDGLRLMSYNFETDEKTEMLNWIDSGINEEMLADIEILNDGRLKLLTHIRDYDTGNQNIQIIFLKKVPFGDLNDRTLLTLAALTLDTETREAVLAFNRTSQTHLIQIIDYSEYSTSGEDGWMAALDKLSLDITTGMIPDMLAIAGGLPLRRYASMGLLEDLYPFIDSDSELSRDSFVDGVLRATELNGSLFRIFPSFAVISIIGNPYFIGDTPGWSMDEFQAVLRANPQADIPLGHWTPRERFLESTFTFYVEEFVDWEAGTADFDNERFISLLEAVALLPADTGVNPNLLSDPELIVTGRQIMFNLFFLDITQYQVYKTVFGGDIVFKGYPSDSGVGSAIHFSAPYFGGVAMTVTCADKEGAWEFMRSSVTPDWQRSNNIFGLPVNKEVFMEGLEKKMIEPEKPQTVRWLEFEVPEKALTQEDADKILDLLANATNTGRWDMHLWNIVNEEATKFFQGGSTVADAARIIQNRASILMSEQAG